MTKAELVTILAGDVRGALSYVVREGEVDVVHTLTADHLRTALRLPVHGAPSAVESDHARSGALPPSRPAQ